MELWDILDENGNPKGYTHERGKPVRDGDYHLVVGSIYSDVTQTFVIPNGYELPSEELKTHDLSSIHIALRYKVIIAINEGLRKVPIISSLLSIGFYFWLTLAFMLIAIAKKKYSLIPAYLVSVGVFVSDILSPVFAEARYAYPLILCTPILILFTVFEYRSKERT